MRQTTIEEFCTDTIACNGTLKEGKDEDSNKESNGIGILGDTRGIFTSNVTGSGENVLQAMEIRTQPES